MQIEEDNNKNRARFSRSSAGTILTEFSPILHLELVKSPLTKTLLVQLGMFHLIHPEEVICLCEYLDIVMVLANLKIIFLKILFEDICGVGMLSCLSLLSY